MKAKCKWFVKMQETVEVYKPREGRGSLTKTCGSEDRISTTSVVQANSGAATQSAIAQMRRTREMSLSEDLLHCETKGQ